MALCNVNFRMDEELKAEMESVCHEMGINMTTAFLIYAKRLTRDRKIPFEMTAETTRRPKGTARRHAGIFSSPVVMSDDFFETPECFKEYI